MAASAEAGTAPAGPPPPAVLKSTAVVVGSVPALHQQSQPMQSKIKMEGGISTVGAIPAVSRGVPAQQTAAATAGGEQRPPAPAVAKQQQQP